MKIAFVTECFPDVLSPQYCVFIEQQAKSLVCLGHSVDIIIPCFDAEDSELFYHDLKIFRLAIQRRFVDGFYRNYRTRIKQKAIKWDNYDFVSVHIISSPFCDAIISDCKDKGARVVVHYHGLNVWENYSEKKDLYHRLLQKIEVRRKIEYLKKVDGIVGVSNSVCEKIKEHHAGNNVFTVYNGVATDLFQPIAKNHKLPFVILCVANLIPIKGHEFLIKAVGQLIEEGYKLNLRLVGNGYYKETLWQLCEKRNIITYVTFIDSLPYHKVAAEMQNCDMYIMPSYYEAFGCVYLESMSTGTVTCGCNCYGAKEIIHDGNDGILVQPQDVDSIVNAIKSVYNDEEKMSLIETNAIRRAEEFSWESSARTLENVYITLL